MATRLLYRDIIGPKTHFAPTPLWLEMRPEVSQLGKRLYGVVLFHVGGNKYAFPSQKALARELATNVRSVKRAIQELVCHHLIEVERHGSGNNRYYLLAHPWQNTLPIQLTDEDEENEEEDATTNACSF